LYFRTIFRGDTRPHVFTWIVYAINDALVFFAQIARGGGPGAWPTMLSVVANSLVVLCGFKYGERHITKSDWISFIGALFGIFFWWLTSDPLSAVLIAMVVNVLGVAPTFRKAYANPFKESITIWGIDVVRFGIALAALAMFNPTTALFPIAIMATNASLVLMILIRRRQLAP